MKDVTIRGILDLCCGSKAKIRSYCHGLKPLEIESTKVTFSNDIEVNNIINSNKSSETYLNANKGNVIINSLSSDPFIMLSRLQSENGYYIEGINNNSRMIFFTKKSIVDANNNTFNFGITLLNEEGYTELNKLRVVNEISSKNLTISNKIYLASGTSASYGTALPSSGKTGELFFKIV